ncbi:MAG: rhodanese-like domain-containing protein [Oscillospiraceae bacterium]|nr:rhodanese-like domain-containing protein [Oscillospiraceae bacterium]
MTITPQEAKKLMDTETDYMILDVRGENEYRESHIPKAESLPLPELPVKAEEMLPDKDQLILVYCHSGIRSAAAADQLEMMGYTNVKDFGGIIRWPFDVTGA